MQQMMFSRGWVFSLVLGAVFSAQTYWYQNTPGPYTLGYPWESFIYNVPVLEHPTEEDNFHTPGPYTLGYPWESFIYNVPILDHPTEDYNFQRILHSNTRKSFATPGTYPVQEFSVLTPYPNQNTPIVKSFPERSMDLTYVYNSIPYGRYAQTTRENLYGRNMENFQGRLLGNLENYLKLIGNMMNNQQNLPEINNPNQQNLPEFNNPKNFHKINNGLKTDLHDLQDLQDHQDSDGPESRILPLIMIKKPKTKMQMRNATCMAKGGKLLDKECYEHITMMLNFDAARTFCMSKGGDLWTPDFNDVLLFKKVLTTFPSIAGAPHNAVWVGAKKLSDGMTVQTVNGTDITSTIFIGIDAFSATTAELCIIYSFAFGYQVAEDDVCTLTYQFVCEYLVDEPKQNSSVLLFNKFNLFKKW